jgi:hypothetical protein
MSTAALRMREYRRRGRVGVVVCDVEVDADVIELLIRAKKLESQPDCHTREAIGRAIQEYMKDSRYA